MLQTRLRESIVHVGQALREPEAFALRWDRREVRYAWWVWLALAATAIVGTTTYGMTMGILGGAGSIFWKGLSCTAAAGLAWSIPLPALYILNSLSGSRLRISTTFLAALVTTSWGGLAMIASIPINWFFSVSIPEVMPALTGEVWVTRLILLVNLAVFAGVGVAMIDVFGRVMHATEPQRGRGPTWWLAVVGAIGSELFYAFGLFQFSLHG
jgi:hypothetical protein